jgi:alanine dehydrogenase
MALNLIILNIPDVQKILTMKDTLNLVETSFKEKALNHVQMPPKSYLFFKKYDGDLRIMPSYLEELDECGVKIVNVHPNNLEKHNLPTVMAIILLYDSATAELVAMMDGTWITAMRTGACTGVATKYLAKSNSRIVGIIGAGYQSSFQLEALKEVMNIEQVKINDIQKEKADEFARNISSKFNLDIIAVDSVEETVKRVDVLVTTTPVRMPIIKNEWITEGTHINAIGADAPGKQELDPEILKRAKVVIDDWAQASHSGEINIPYQKSIISKNDISAEIGEIVAGLKPGRVSNEEITVFDSTGLSIQDVITGWHVYRIAKEKGLGKEIDTLYGPT